MLPLQHFTTLIPIKIIGMKREMRNGSSNDEMLSGILVEEGEGIFRQTCPIKQRAAHQ